MALPECPVRLPRRLRTSPATPRRRSSPRRRPAANSGTPPTRWRAALLAPHGGSGSCRIHTRCPEPQPLVPHWRARAPSLRGGAQQPTGFPHPGDGRRPCSQLGANVDFSKSFEKYALLWRREKFREICLEASLLMCPRLAPRSSLTFHRLLRPHAPPREPGPLAPPLWMPTTAPRQVAHGPRSTRRRRNE